MALPLEQIDIENVTLGELARIYSREQELKSPLSLGTTLSKYKDMPASQFFDDTAEGGAIAKQVVRNAQGNVTDSAMKGTLKALRYLSNRLYNAYDSNPPSYLISNEKNTPKAAQEFFGTKEPPKAVSSIQVNTSPETRKAFITELMRYGASNPEKMPEIRAIIFGLNTGLRPNANLGIKPGDYKPDSGSLYIPATETGAKGRAISIPLNNVADSMIQQQLAQFGEKIKETGTIFVDSEGKPIKTASINAILEEIKVPDLLYDEATGKYYDSFKPAGGESSKFGMSLFRNYHTTLGQELGIPDSVLAKLQGRSLTAQGKKAGIGELYTYSSRFPGRVSEYEREQANILAKEYSGSISEAVEEVKVLRPDFTFDHGAETDVVKTRVTEATEGFGSDYFKREVAEATEAPKGGVQVDITTQDKSLTDAERKGFIDKFLNFGKGTLKVLPIAGAGLAFTQKKAEAEEMIEAGEGKMPAYLQKGAEFIAEEFTPYGTAKDIAGAAGAQAEAFQERGKQLLEESTTQTEEELLQSFGEFGAEVRGIK